MPKSSDTKKRGVIGFIGANINGSVREKNDYYTSGDGAISLLEKKYKLPKNVWECACGNGALSKQLEDANHKVYSTEKYKRGYGITGVDFLKTKSLPKGYNCIITNPPYNCCKEFVIHALELTKNKKNGVVAMLLKTQFLETKCRYDEIFKDNPPTYLFQFIRRFICYKNDDRKAYKGSMMPYMWFIWDNKIKEKETKLFWI